MTAPLVHRATVVPPWPHIDEDTGVPIVYVERRGSNSLVFACPYCMRNHTHGAAGGTGHRVAHCFSEAGRQVFARGYLLVERDVVATAVDRRK